MDERQVHRFLTDLCTDLSPENEYDLRHEDHVMEMPQSGERIRGRDKMRELQEFHIDHSARPPSGLGGCW
jgi:hypothetical protein